MKHLVAIICVLAAPAFGQTTWERFVRIQDNPGNSTSNVWTLAWSDRTNAPHWWTWYAERGGTAPIAALPVMVDMDTGEQVQITNGNAQAKTELTGQDKVRRPARKALKDYLAGTSQKDKRKALRQAITAADTVPTLRKAVRDMDEFRELIEDAEDERQLLGRKKDNTP